MEESMKPLPKDAYETWHKVYDDALVWCRNPNTATEIANKSLIGWLQSNGMVNNVIAELRREYGEKE